MAAIQEGHLSISLDPDLVPCVFRETRKCSYVQAKLASLCELAFEMLDIVLQEMTDVPKHVPSDNSLSLEIEVEVLVSRLIVCVTAKITLLPESGGGEHRPCNTGGRVAEDAAQELAL